MLRNAIIDFNTVTTASVRLPRFEIAINETMASAFGTVVAEETSAGHFYSDEQIMPADKGPMMDMCHTDGHDGFFAHIISTHLGEFGEIDD